MERSPEPHSAADNIMIAVYELLGTFILVATIVLTGKLATVGGYFVAIMLAGHVSGAHFNPAISLAVVVGRHLGDAKKAMMMLVYYWVP